MQLFRPRADTIARQALAGLILVTVRLLGRSILVARSSMTVDEAASASRMSTASTA